MGGEEPQGAGLSEGELESLRQASEMTALKATLLPIRTVGVQVGGATMGGEEPQGAGLSEGELESLRQASEMTALKATLLPIRTVGVQVGGATMGGEEPQGAGLSEGELESLRQASEMTALKATLLPIRTVGVQVGGATEGGATGGAGRGGEAWPQEGWGHRGEAGSLLSTITTLLFAVINKKCRRPSLDVAAVFQGDARSYSYVAALSSDEPPNWPQLHTFARLIPRICHKINRFVDGENNRRRKKCLLLLLVSKDGVECLRNLPQLMTV